MKSLVAQGAAGSGALAAGEWIRLAGHRICSGSGWADSRRDSWFSLSGELAALQARRLPCLCLRCRSGWLGPGSLPRPARSGCPGADARSAAARIVPAGSGTQDKPDRHPAEKHQLAAHDGSFRSLVPPGLVARMTFITDVMVVTLRPTQISARRPLSGQIAQTCWIPSHIAGYPGAANAKPCRHYSGGFRYSREVLLMHFRVRWGLPSP